MPGALPLQGQKETLWTMSPGTPAGPTRTGPLPQLTLGAVPAIATPPIGPAALVEPIRIEGLDPAPLRLAAILVAPVGMPPIAFAPITALVAGAPPPLGGCLRDGKQ